MAFFTKKTWEDRRAEFINRRTLTKEDGTEEIVTVARNEGTVSAEGDAFNAETMNNLEGRVEAGFNAVNESLIKKQDDSTAITTSNISSQNVNSVGGSTINDIHTDAQKRVNTRQEKLIMELYTASTNANYAIVNKEGYTLLSAHSVRDDSSYFVKGINKRNDGRYTLIIDGLTSSATMSFWLTWAKE